MRMHKVSKNNELKWDPVLSAITESPNWPLILLFNMEYLGMDHYYRVKFCFREKRQCFYLERTFPGCSLVRGQKKQKTLIPKIESRAVSEKVLFGKFCHQNVDWNHLDVCLERLWCEKTAMHRLSNVKLLSMVKKKKGNFNKLKQKTKIKQISLGLSELCQETRSIYLFELILKWHVQY